MSSKVHSLKHILYILLHILIRFGTYERGADRALQFDILRMSFSVLASLMVANVILLLVILVILHL